MFFRKKKPKGDGSGGADPELAQSPAAPGLEADLQLEALFVDCKPAVAQEPRAPEQTLEAQTEEPPLTAPGKAKTGLVSRLWGRVVRSAHSREDSAPTPVQAPATGTAGPAVTEQAVEAAPPQRVPPAAIAASKPHRRKRELTLAVEVGGGRTLFWRLTAAGVERLDQMETYSKAIRFSREDWRFEVEGRVGQGQAEALALQELGDAVELVNRSRQWGLIYATKRTQVTSVSYRFGPGQVLIDRLVRERMPEPAALIVGLDLKDASGRSALLILYYLSASGRSSSPQVSVYPEDRDFLLSQFAAAQQAARENAQVLLLDQEALWAVSHDVALYPIEPMLGPVPLRLLWSQVAALSLMAALATTLWTHQLSLQHDRARGELARAEEAVTRIQRANTALLESSPRALARALTLDVPTASARAREVWVPSARVQMVVTATGMDFTVILPLASPRAGHQSSTLVGADPALVYALLALKTPVGCKRTDVHFSETLNEAQLTVRCETPPHPLARYGDS